MHLWFLKMIMIMVKMFMMMICFLKKLRVSVIPLLIQIKSLKTNTFGELKSVRLTKMPAL